MFRDFSQKGIKIRENFKKNNKFLELYKIDKISLEIIKNII
jgi:hypothetical protein